jgi:hypothetical protein
MAQAGHVRMRQLVHQNQAGLQAQGFLQVKFLHLHATVCHLLHRKARQPADQPHGILPSVGLRHADDHFHPFVSRLDGRFQHGVRLPHARRHAEENFQQTPARTGFLPPDGGQNPVRPLAVRMRF